MANQIVRRLIAAGASPQKANQFAMQFQKTLPGSNLKPTDVDDAFDLQLDAASRAMFPNVFRPPTADDPQIDGYIEFIAPGQVAKITERAYKFSAPTLFAAQKSTIPYEKTLVGLVKSGVSLAKIQELIAVDLAANDPDLLAYPVLGLTDDVGSAASKSAEKLFSEYGAVQEKLITERESFLNKDQNYKYGLPDPKLTYGYSTNFKKGTIGVDTIPGVKDYFTKANASFRDDPNRAGASQAGGIAIDAIVKKVAGKGLTPNKDEQQRRFNLKYQK